MVNRTFYLKAYKKYGITARGLNWNDKESQYIRFEIILEFLKDEISKSSLVDAGCGFGDFYLFLQEKNLLPKSYVGIDCMQDFIDIAKQKLPHCAFTCRDILKDELVYADWYVASGSLNILNSFETWIFLEKMLMYAKKGVVFNILEGDKRSENFNYQKKEDIIAYVRSKGFSCKLKSNYLKNDITVEIRK
jgi:SAM-dependent methyltransferase